MLLFTRLMVMVKVELKQPGGLVRDLPKKEIGELTSYLFLELQSQKLSPKLELLTLAMRIDHQVLTLTTTILV